MGQEEPCEVCRNFFRGNLVLVLELVTFMDYQKYAFQMSWDKQFIMWLMSRNGG